MTLRIFQEETDSETIIALHGRLSSAEVEDVMRLAEAHRKALRIDLGSLVGADALGLRALRRLQGGGARLSGASPFVALMLERTPLDEGS
jgi:anti-anti-sigma regulatory factor